MDVLASAKQLMRSGRFGDAFGVLENGPIPLAQRVAAQVLKSEALERIGRLGQSRSLATTLLKSNLSNGERAACEYVIGKVCLEDGETDEALSHLQRAASLSAEAGDSYHLCWTQIALLTVIADRLGNEAAMPILAEARASATRAGDPQLLAALHVRVAKIDGKRGLGRSARRHARFARELLEHDPNVWLEAAVENIDFAASIVGSDFEAARLHGFRAHDLAQASGVASTCCACLCNLGNLHQSQGRLEQAVDCFERALTAFSSRSENALISLESLARVRLLQGRKEDCLAILERIEGSIQNDSDRARYAYRHAELTRAQLLWRDGRLADAHVHTDRALELAQRVGDGFLYQLALITKAQLFLDQHRIDDALSSLRDVLTYFSSESPELHAQYEQAFACASAATGDLGSARLHYERAKRLYESLHSASGTAELERIWTIALEPTLIREEAARPSRLATPASSTARDVLHSMAALMIHGGRFEYVAREIVSLVSTTGCLEYAAALVRVDDGSNAILAETGTAPQGSVTDDYQYRLAIGSTSGGAVEIVLAPKKGVESSATISSVMVVVAALHDLQDAREEREQRAALWQVEETLPQDGCAVSTGHMQEVMMLATRVASTNVSVLITGESGTGKEVVARAIHTYSDRAQKPFIPFNCTAVPREMLESQLFGHRRGAFTGADRDNPGVIRAARDGTLFLDEIGEMGLDLQPKLLRFLESGEICPLGESTPFSVNVRIVAATNSNLEALVKEGRFREDLFYRLNVIRLSIRPLRERRDEIPGLIHHFVARAAKEFRKDQLRIADETIERLLLYSWPGNVRQLQNELRRMVAFAEPNTVLTVSDISDEILSVTPAPVPVSASRGREIAVPLTEKLLPTLNRIEREMIKVALRDNHGRIDAAAKALGISRKGLYLKRQRLGL